MGLGLGLGLVGFSAELLGACKTNKSGNQRCMQVPSKARMVQHVHVRKRD